MKTWTLAAGALLLVGCAGRGGQVRRDEMERAQDRRELAQDVRQTEDDRFDSRTLRVLREHYERARRENPNAIGALDARAIGLMDRELNESARELGQDQNEVDRDRGELGSDRREVRRDVREGKARHETADDVRDRRDDRRDLNDDRRDRGQERAALERLGRIRGEFVNLSGRLDVVALNRKQALIDDLVQMSEHELVRDRRERHEDHRELREDRKETREDRRQEH